MTIPRGRIDTLSPFLLIIEPPTCCFKRHFPHLCVCDGHSPASSQESDIDAVNFEMYHTLHPGDEIDVLYEPAGAAVSSATADTPGRFLTAGGGKGKAPANNALKQLMWDRLSPAGSASNQNDEAKSTGTKRSAGAKEVVNKVMITELTDLHTELVHASPYNIVVHGAACCTERVSPHVMTMEKDGLWVVESHVRPRNTCGGEHDGVTVVEEGLVARPQ